QLAQSDHSVALGAAMLGCLAAGKQATGYRDMTHAIKSMARQRDDLVYRHDARAKKAYAKLYPLYRQMAERNGPVAEVMRQLREWSHETPSRASGEKAVRSKGPRSSR